MIGSVIHWECQHYGTILDDYQTEVQGVHIRNKIYKFDYRLFLEVWENGKVILFKKL